MNHEPINHLPLGHEVSGMASLNAVEQRIENPWLFLAIGMVAGALIVFAAVVLFT
jgi:hypothetical protein